MPRILNTPGGNALIIDALRKLHGRQIERSEMASEFELREMQKPGGRFKQAAFEREWKTYVDENPLFADSDFALEAQPDGDGWSIREIP